MSSKRPDMIGIFAYIWKRSRREQLVILAVVCLSFPFYYASLELPKYIISDALQGRAFPEGQETARLFRIALNLPEALGGPRTLFDGLQLHRLSYLFALSGLFLLLVLINGLFKYVVNMRKGALGERLLQRLRFDLFSALLGSGPETLQRIKPSEAATVIKDEVEPIGGFVGDAFVQPVLLGGQALTALIFILVQNAALGMIALGMILLQAVLISRLRREQIELGRQRQIASRAFAGKIGEIVESVGEIANHGTSAVEKSQVADRLEQLFGIRYRLYRRKFAVKALNNLLAQFTPFLFYAAGGYLALTGRLGIGQLVAVIAAYRDLPPPIKELIDWDQQRLDVEVKFQQVVEHFGLEGAPSRSEVPDDRGEPLPAAAAILGQRLSVMNTAGDRVLDRVSVSLPLQAHTVLSGGPSEGAGVLARLLGGRLSPGEGTLTIGGMPLSALSPETRGRLIAYAGSEPVILDGSLRDNILYSLRRPDMASPSGWRIDYAQAQVIDEGGLDHRLVEVLKIVGLAEAVFRFGLAGKPVGEAGAPLALMLRISELRARIRRKLAAGEGEGAIEPYDPASYARNATIGENILFGVPNDPALVGARLAGHWPTRRILSDSGLNEALTALGRRMAATMLEIFRDLAPGHALFERFSFVAAEEFGDYREALARLDTGSGSEDDRTRLIGLALLYVEPRHRLGLLDREMEARLLAARTAFRQWAASSAVQPVAFYDPQLYCPAAPLRDNLLFGLVARDAADEAIRDTLAELGLDSDVYRWGLDQQAGHAGRRLFPAVKAQLALARCLIKQPRMLILDNALGAFGRTEARQILDRIRAAMAGRTLIVAGSDIDPDGYDLHIAFDGPRLAVAQDASGLTPIRDDIIHDEAAPDREELRALRAVPIFADLDTAHLKLIAFTSERIAFAAGDALFRQGDEPDAAYVLLSGTADVLVATDEEPALRMSGVSRNAIVGEMGIVTGDPRSATIVATSAIAALKLRKEVFLALLAEVPPMALSVMRLMARRLQGNLAMISQRDRDETSRLQ